MGCWHGGKGGGINAEKSHFLGGMPNRGRKRTLLIRTRFLGVDEDSRRERRGKCGLLKNLSNFRTEEGGKGFSQC